nr:uroporphyrinogen decarboxylase family protein [bacterium]
MTSRERIRACLTGKPVDRTPFTLGMGINGPVLRDMMQTYGVSEQKLFAWLGQIDDIAQVSPRYIGPEDRECHLPGGRYKDIWGVVRKPVSYGLDSYMEIETYPLAQMEDASELADYAWPQLDWLDFDSIGDVIAKVRQEKGDKAILVPNGNPFESAWYLRGFEQMLEDLLVNPDFAWELLTRVTDWHIAMLTTTLQHADGQVDIVMTADDIGHQQGLLCSKALWEKMIKPHHVRLNRALKEYGVFIRYHTDGAVYDALDGMIDMGIDIFEAVQTDAAGMEPERLIDKVGDRLRFQGGVPVQSILPFGTPEEVRESVRRMKRTLGRYGGYICAPSHAIQAGTPVENVMAFIDEALEGTMPPLGKKG